MRHHDKAFVFFVADLRKLPLKDARAILRKNGVPEDAIMKLSRWEVIDVVRTLSTEKVKAGEDGDHKFSRGNRFSIAEHQERYREDCQRIFEVQNKVLASKEILSSDEGESSEDEDANDDDLDEMGKNLENMLSNKKTSTQFLREREEAERRKLQKMIMGDEGDGDQQGQKRKKEEGEDEEDGGGPPKVLRITRTFRNEAGNLYTRTEFVRKPLVVETYVKVRETKVSHAFCFTPEGRSQGALSLAQDEAFIRQFATLDESAKEEMKKEKRRIQEQLRRIKRNQVLFSVVFDILSNFFKKPLLLGKGETDNPPPFGRTAAATPLGHRRSRFLQEEATPGQESQGPEVAVRSVRRQGPHENQQGLSQVRGLRAGDDGPGQCGHDREG